MPWLKFAPLWIPLSRRLQTFAVALYYYSFYFGALAGFSLVLLLLFTSYYPLALLYLGWAYLYDRGTPSHGGRRSKFMRKLWLWKYFRDYFPISLIKTADLDRSKNYIFGYHPHGLLCAGAFCCFATEGTNFSEVFPGITPHLLPLMALFKPPIFRDYIMSSGMCDVSRESCEYILSRKGPGNSVCIVIGGAVEALDAKPGQYIITIKPRKGFIHLALKTGSYLVPTFAFGENDLFNQVDNPEGSWLRDIQCRIQKIIGFAPVIFYGRGIFQYTFGLIPHRRPINVVVGKPIPVERTEHPTHEQVNDLHSVYVTALQDLFEENKSKYDIHKDAILRLR